MSQVLDSVLADCAARLDQVRQDMRHGDVQSFVRNPYARDVSARLRAGAYVWLAASLEGYVSAALQGVLDEVNALSLACGLIRPSLLVLMCDPEFESLRTKRKKLEVWVDRTTLIQRVQPGCSELYSATTLPLDGKTIKAAHFDAVWRVFGFSGPSLPHQKCRLALEDLSVNRNRVAHGDVDPVAFGKTKTNADILRLVDNVEDIVLHVHDAGCTYLSNDGYRR